MIVFLISWNQYTYIVYVIYVKSKKISSRNFQGRIQEIMKKDNRDENWEEEKLFNCGRGDSKIGQIFISWAQEYEFDPRTRVKRS